MYSPVIAARLRERGHDAASAQDRDDLSAASDATILETVQAERRVIVTNNVRDFMPLANQALRSGAAFYGIVFTNDRSLPRSKQTIGTFVDLLDALLNAHADTDALEARVEWLTPT